MGKDVKIAPSILAADFARLVEQIRAAEAGGADFIHIDVMDGHFVPNITVGPAVVHAVRGVTNLPLDVHLMIENPEQYVPEFARAGADALVVHVEATTDLHRVLNQIHDLGIRAGVSLNPATPATEIEEMLDDVDLTLAMTVNPGFGGQTFIEATLSKLALLREMLDATGNEVDLHVDGGIEPQTACRAVAAGATVLVAGEAIFGAKEGIAKSIEALREGARRGMCLRNGG